MAAFPRPTVLAVTFALLAGGCSGPEPSSEVGTPSPTPAVTTSSPASSRTPAEATYRVELRANADGTRWRGSQRVGFTNTGGIALRRVWFRSWANGVDGCDPLAVAVANLRGGSAGELRVGCTAWAVTLPEPLAPGASARVGFDLDIRVPARNDRFGAWQGTALLGNALPILAVNDDDGWHLDPYVDIGESFYSEVADYRVSLDVPQVLDTPSSGRQVDLARPGRREVRTYLAQEVRDFAWAAGDLEVATSRAGGITVNVWYRPAFLTAQRARATGRDVETSMAAFADAFGPYPASEIDVVTAAFVTFGGMEYPQIVFANPERHVLSHELAHQWWYGLVGNDEFTEPWLDESFATWSEFLPWSPWRGCDRYDWPSPTARITNDMAYWASHPKEYATIYTGGGCMLADLAGRFGLSRFIRVLGDYAERHRLGVTTTAAFRRTIERVAARHLDGFDAERYWATWRVD
jgi:hypothetical protein